MRAPELTDPVIADILDAHRGRIAALKAGNLRALDRFVADDLVYVSPQGRLQRKHEVFAALGSGDLRVEGMDCDPPFVRVYGDTAILVYRAAVRMREGGRLFIGNVRSSAVFARRDGRWKLVSQHQSVIGA